MSSFSSSGMFFISSTSSSRFDTTPCVAIPAFYILHELIWLLRIGATAYLLSYDFIKWHGYCCIDKLPDFQREAFQPHPRHPRRNLANLMGDTISGEQLSEYEIILRGGKRSNNVTPKVPVVEVSCTAFSTFTAKSSLSSVTSCPYVIWIMAPAMSLSVKPVSAKLELQKKFTCLCIFRSTASGCDSEFFRNLWMWTFWIGLSAPIAWLPSCPCIIRRAFLNRSPYRKSGSVSPHPILNKEW